MHPERKNAAIQTLLAIGFSRDELFHGDLDISSDDVARATAKVGHGNGLPHWTSAYFTCTLPVRRMSVEEAPTCKS